MAYWLDESPDWQSRAGFLEKRFTASGVRLKLFDGSWLNLNSNAGKTVTWSNS